MTTFIFENSLLKLGGATASFPSLKQVGAAIELRLADDSGFTDLTVQNLTVKGVATFEQTPTFADPSGGQVALGLREQLTADRTYYVRTDGNDSNNGLTNTAGGAFLTVQRAIEVLNGVDFRGFTVTIQVGAGSYPGSVVIQGQFPGQTGPDSLIIQGDTSTPANVEFSFSTTNEPAVLVGYGAQATVRGIRFNGGGSASGSHSLVCHSGTLWFSEVEFGPAAGHQLAYLGGAIVAKGNYSIVGNTRVHIYAFDSAQVVCEGRTVTLTGTPTWATAFVQAFNVAALELFGNTYVGSASGPRYLITRNAVVDVRGAGASYLPGSSAGSTASGGQYV